MASKFETGHFKNFANFGTLINYLATLPTYTPDNPNLEIAALTVLRNDVETASNNLMNEAATLQVSVNARYQQFAQMRKIATRLMRYLDVISVDEETINDVKTHYNALSTKRVVRIQKIGEDGSVSEKTYSTSRQSYESLAENFQKMVVRILNIDSYAPSEQAIQANTLQNLSQQLHITNEMMNSQLQTVNTARNLRDQLMYKTGIGLFDTVKKIKKYLQFKFGTRSDQVKYASALTFTKKQIRVQDPIVNI